MTSQIAKNLSYWIKKRNTNPTSLSKTSGVSQPTIFKLLNEKSKSPGIDTLEKLAKALDASLFQILYSPELPKEAIPIKGFRKVPLISWVQAGLPMPIADLESPDAWYLCPVDISESGYALRVKGESMEPKFFEGDIVFVDPEVSAEPGRIVVVVDDDAVAPEATLKKLIKDGSEYYLRALNPDWPGPKFLPLKKSMRIAGVAVGKYVEL